MTTTHRSSGRKASRSDQRALSDLVSVGPATIADLRLLGITRVAQLRGRSAETLYRRLCVVTGVRHDSCAKDVFAAAIAQANDPGLPARQRNWWYWSGIRKANTAS